MIPGRNSVDPSTVSRHSIQIHVLQATSALSPTPLVVGVLMLRISSWGAVHDGSYGGGNIKVLGSLWNVSGFLVLLVSVELSRIAVISVEVVSEEPSMFISFAGWPIAEGTMCSLWLLEEAGTDRYRRLASWAELLREFNPNPNAVGGSIVPAETELLLVVLFDGPHPTTTLANICADHGVLVVAIQDNGVAWKAHVVEGAKKRSISFRFGTAQLARGKMPSLGAGRCRAFLASVASALWGAQMESSNVPPIAEACGWLGGACGGRVAAGCVGRAAGCVGRTAGCGWLGGACDGSATGAASGRAAGCGWLVDGCGGTCRRISPPNAPSPPSGVKPTTPLHGSCWLQLEVLRTA